LSALEPISQRQPSLALGLKIQLRVIGAIIIRELHTRFGRDNIGYLWLILEPMLLAAGITIAHLAAHTQLRGGLDIAPFYITGYVVFMIFRSSVNRSAATIESNRTLLYHRQVTLFDLAFARIILEVAATTLALAILLLGCQVFGLGTLPQRPMLLLASVGLMAWFTFGITMLVTAASEEWPVVERLVLPATYLAIPASGMLFLLEWLPESASDLLKWLPLTQILDLARMGQYESFNSTFIDLPYLMAWCTGLTFLGMLALRIIRRRTHVE
jgi:capsular polysaccharide transport system permease protein